jgi:hypothetical protein
MPDEAKPVATAVVKKTGIPLDALRDALAAIDVEGLRDAADALARASAAHAAFARLISVNHPAHEDHILANDLARRALGRAHAGAVQALEGLAEFGPKHEKTLSLFATNEAARLALKEKSK